MPIRILDATIVGKIAAGEVVERPSSVVKELLENALDAGASSITVEIRDGGIAYLRVTDNGCGIEPEQVRLAFENHATSKLCSVEQLEDIRTLGFRGEALPSIAAVSRMEMTTRARNRDTGVRLTVEGGENLAVREVGSPEGTTAIMRDLFFNLPVRRAFLKKPAYEAALVSDVVARMILGNPGVSFRYINNGRTIYHSFGDGELRHAVFAVYGRETAEKMRAVDRYEGGMRIRGLIGIGEQAKTSRGHEAFFINGRNVRCPLLSQALESVCRERVTVGMYPMCALHLTLPPSSVDVNVHPNKLEVRFRDEVATRVAVESMLRDALSDGAMLNMRPEPPLEMRAVRTAERLEGGSFTGVQAPPFMQGVARMDETKVFNKPSKVENSKTGVFNKQTDVFDGNRVLKNLLSEDRMPGAADATRTLREGLPVVFPPAVPSEPAPVSAPTGQSFDVQGSAAPYRVIGVLFKTYILLECEDALLLIDQHAAHERLRYDEMVRSLEAGVASQRLISPEILRITAREMALVEEHMDALRAAGYDIEPFGERDIQIRAVPHVLGHADLKPNFAQTLQVLSQLGSAALEARRDEILQRACKGAVKAGDTLTDSEISALLRQMEQSGSPPTCPHGRPVVKTLMRREIERMFKRIQ